MAASASVKVVVVPTGTANIASVITGLRRAGAKPRLEASAEDIRSASHIVLPGVGAFAPAMERLVDQGRDQLLRERIEQGRPTLAICLGLQLLCNSSEESPGSTGLGVIPSHIQRFPRGVRVPQMGWNRIESAEGSQILQSGYAYFANSYRLTTAPYGWRSALCDYAGPFIAALERGAVCACQFHPELSGVWGQALLQRWLQTSDYSAGHLT